MTFLELMQFEFMQRAMVAAFCVAIMTPIIGQVIVLRRMSAVGDALSHTGLAGVALGLILSFDPVLGAVIAAVCAGLAIELIRRAFSRYAELSVSITLSVGVGLTAVLSGFAPQGGFYNFLFGSIVAISHSEMVTIALLSAVVILIALCLYPWLLHIAFDEESAAAAGIPVKWVNLLFTLLTAVTVAVSARTVGALIISSLIVVPVAAAMQVSRSYRGNLVWAIAFALMFTFVGLMLSHYYDLRPGGTIVLTGAATLMLLIGINTVRRKI